MNLRFAAKRPTKTFKLCTQNGRSVLKSPMTVMGALLGLLLGIPMSHAAGQCAFSDDAGRDARQAGWSVTPPCSSTVERQAFAVTPFSGATGATTKTGDAPNKLPYLRHPAGGDPVLGEGEFVEVRKDAELAGYGLHYEFVRTYRSRARFQGALGFGWDHNYDQRIIGIDSAFPGDVSSSNPTDPAIDPFCDKSVDFQDGALNRVHFTFQRSELVPAPNNSFYQKDYYQAQGGVGLLLTFWKDLGVRHWQMVYPDGTLADFDPRGYLSALTDPVGNRLTFDWERPPQITDMDDPSGAPERLLRVHDGARTINYIYHDGVSSSYYTLACVTLGTDCGAFGAASSDVLVSFSYADYSGWYANLKQVIHGSKSGGESYIYRHEVGDPVDTHTIARDCEPSADLLSSCAALCLSPTPGVPNTCRFAGYGDQVDGWCSKHCVTPSPDSEHWFENDKWCHYDDEHHEACCKTIDGSMYQSTDKDGNVVGGNEKVPCCIDFPEADHSVNQVCRAWYIGGSTCIQGCIDRNQCIYMPDSEHQYTIFSFGVPSDLQQNIVEVRDEQDHTVVVNQYGELPWHISFDRVTTQYQGPIGDGNAIRFEYHDLEIEAKATGSIEGRLDLPQYPADKSTPNPLVINPHLPGTSWVSEELCPSTCISGDPAFCTVQGYNQPVIAANGEVQWPFHAVVIHDLHGTTRIQYLDQHFDIVREVFIATDGTTTKTTDYNYDANGFLQALREPGGIRHCEEHDRYGRLRQDTAIPIAGYPGNSDPVTTIYAYDSIGRLTDVTVDPLGIPSVTHTQRDDKGRIAWVTQDVGGGKPQLRTVYDYSANEPANLLGMPSKITYPNGRIDIFANYHWSMGGPTSMIIDSTSDDAEQRHADYDNRGRRIADGEVNRYEQKFDYNKPGVVTAWHRLSPTDPWIGMVVSSWERAGEEKPSSVVTGYREDGSSLRTATYLYSGGYPFQETLVASAGPVNTTLPPPRTTCFNYSSDGRLEDVWLPEGNQKHLVYDSFNRFWYSNKGYGVSTSGGWNSGCVVKNPLPGEPTNASGGAVAYQPDGFIWQKWQNDISTTFHYDGLGRVLQSDNSLSDYGTWDTSAFSQYGLDIRGRVIWHSVGKPFTGIPERPYLKPGLTDPNLISFEEFEYDLLGRKLKEHHWALETGEDQQVTYDYNDQNRTTVVNDRGSISQFEYDTRGRLVVQTFPDQSKKRITYFIGGEIIKTETNQGTVLTRTRKYDTRGLVTEVDDENGLALWSASYDDQGNRISETNAGRSAIGHRYDAFGEVIFNDEIVGGSLVSTQYTYDRNGRLTDYVDGEKNAWSMSYSGNDQPLTIKDPMGRTGTYSYIDGFIRPSGLVEPNGLHKAFDYDWNWHLVNVYEGDCPFRYDSRFDSCAPLQPRRHFEYSTDGKLLRATAPAQSQDIPEQAAVTRTYDSLSRIVDESVGLQSNVHHEYTDAGRTVTTQVTYATSVATMTHHFDLESRLSKIELNGAPVASWEYGVGLGGPLSSTYSDGSTTTYSYDSRLRQNGIQVAMPTAKSGQPAIVAALSEVFGVDSTLRMRQVQIGRGPVLTDVFQVDSNGRLSAENLGLQQVPLLSGEITNDDVSPYMKKGKQWRSYTLDTIGNIKNGQTATKTFLFEIDRLSRVTKVDGKQVPIDKRDNLEESDSSAKLVFDDYSNNLVSAQNKSIYNYEYDALDRRLVEHRPGADVAFIWDGQRVIAHGESANLTLDIPGSDIDSHIASVELGTGHQRFYHQGPDQSVLAVTDTSGLVEGYTYSAFGETHVWNSGGSERAASQFDNRFAFQGQLYDPLTKTYSMRAREYQPLWGRFLSPDPLSFSAAPSLYAFTGSKPLDHRDPLGMEDKLFGGCGDQSRCTDSGENNQQAVYVNGIPTYYINETGPNVSPDFYDELAARGRTLITMFIGGQSAGDILPHRSGDPPSAGPPPWSGPGHPPRRQLSRGYRIAGAIIAGIPGAARILAALTRARDLAGEAGFGAADLDALMAVPPLAPEVAAVEEAGAVVDELMVAAEEAAVCAQDLSSVLKDPVAESSRTVAVIATISADGSTFAGAAGGAQRNLSAVQQALAETMDLVAIVLGGGDHAEGKLLQIGSDAMMAVLSASRPFCGECTQRLIDAGFTIVGPATAIKGF